MAINRGKQIGLLAGLGVGASLLLKSDAGREVRRRAGTHLKKTPETNHTLASRVEAELEHNVAHATAIQVFADDKQVILRGHAQRDEIDDVFSAVRQVEGIRGVTNQLEVLDSPGNVLALQG
jgi:osmotically-inducible protein OsmY